jgi:hypothetical protein
VVLSDLSKVFPGGRWRWILHQKYRTTYVTHDQVEAMTLGDRIAVLNAGRLQQAGTRRSCTAHRATCSALPRDEPRQRHTSRRHRRARSATGRVPLARCRRPPGVPVTAVAVESLGSEKNLLFLPPSEVPDVVGDAMAAAETELAAM